MKGKGFVGDSYQCKCKKGFYVANQDPNANYSNSSSTVFKCTKCPDGCEACSGKLTDLVENDSSLKILSHSILFQRQYTVFARRSVWLQTSGLDRKSRLYVNMRLVVIRHLVSHEIECK